MEYIKKLVALTTSPLVPTKALMKSLRVVGKTTCDGNESDGKANTRPESTDYDGLYVELGRE